MEDVVVGTPDDRPDQDEAEGRRIAEVLFYKPLAATRSNRSFGYWVTVIGAFTMMRRFQHVCLRVGRYQYHCSPHRNVYSVLHVAAEQVMPHTAKILWPHRLVADAWDDTLKFQMIRSLLWRWHLLPIQDSAMNCVTMTCRLIGLPNIARTPSHLYERLLERT